MHDDMTMLMSLVLDGEASHEQRERLFQHVAECEHCARRWAQWRAFDVRLASAPVLMPPAGFAESVMARIEAVKPRKSGAAWLAPGLMLLWAGTIAIGAILVGLVVWWGARHPAELSILAASMMQLLSSLVAMLGGLRVLLGGIDPLAFGLFTGALLGCTTALALFWYWAVNRQMRAMRRSVVLEG